MKRAIAALKRVSWARWLGGAGVLFFALLVAGYLVLSSEWFADNVRQRIITEVGRTTGAQVAMGRLEFDIPSFTAVAQRIVIRNPASAADAPPLLSVPRLELQLGVTSFFASSVSLRMLRLESPEIHIDVAADGSIDMPRPAEPGPAVPGDTAAVGALLDLAVRRFAIDAGKLYVNSVPHDLSFASERFHLRAGFEPVFERYGVWVRLGESSLVWESRRPVVSEIEADLYIYRGHLEAPEFYARSGDSTIHGSLTLASFTNPTIDANYRLGAPIAPWADYLGVQGVREGTLEGNGSLSWASSSGALGYEGDLQLAGLGYRDQTADVSQVNLTGHYAGDLERLSIQPLQVSALGGVFEGQAEAFELAAEDGPRLRLEGALKGFRTSALLAAIRKQDFTNDAVGLQGTLSGRLRAEGRRAADMTAAIALIFDGDGAPTEGLIPLNGALDLTYSGRSRTAEISRGELHTPGSSATASGTLSMAGPSRLAVELRSSSWDEIQKIAASFGQDLTRYPARLRGDVSLIGEVSGQIAEGQASQAVFTGRLAVNEFDIRDYPIRSLTAGIEYRPESVRIADGALRGSPGSIDFTLGAALEDGKPGDDLPIEGRIKLSEIPVARVLAAAGRPEPVQASLNGQLLVGGTLARPSGSAQLTATKLELWKEPFDALAADVRYSGDQLNLTSLELSRGEASMRLAAEHSITRKQFKFKLASSGWNLEDFRFARESEAAPTGALTLGLEGSGRLGEGGKTFETLNVSGNWGVDAFSYDGKPLGSLQGALASQDDRIAVDWSAEMLAGQFQGHADIDNLPEFPISGDVNFTEIGVVPLADFFGSSVRSVAGEIDGKAKFSGKLADMDQLEASGEITRVGVGLAELPGAGRGYALWNPFPMRWSYANKVLDLDHMRLLGEGTDFELDGQVDTGETGKLDIAADGTLNLAVLESFRPDLEASGSSTISAKISGTLDDPLLIGQMRFRDGSVRSFDFPNGLSEMNGAITFTGTRMRIDQLTAQSGGGLIRAEGSAEYGGDALNYRFNITAERVRVRYPATVSSTYDGRLSLSGTGSRSLVSGEITVTRMNISAETDLGGVLASLGEPPETPATSPVLQNIQFNVHVGSVPDLRIETSLVRNLQGSVDLRLSGTALNPSLLGRTSFTQGEIEFRGSRYDINRGDLSFVNPFRIEPLVNFELETRIGGVDIALLLSGPARKMNLTYRSDPPLQMSDLINLIAVGRAPTTDPVLAAQQSVTQQSLIQTGANTVLSQAIAQPFSRRLQRFFGVSRLKVDPQIGGAEANPSARISTEQQITNDLTFTYSYDLSSAQQQVVRVEYQPNRRWSIIVVRDENGLLGSDFVYKKRLP